MRIKGLKIYFNAFKGLLVHFEEQNTEQQIHTTQSWLSGDYIIKIFLFGSGLIFMILIRMFMEDDSLKLNIQYIRALVLLWHIAKMKVSDKMEKSLSSFSAHFRFIKYTSFSALSFYSSPILQDIHLPRHIVPCLCETWNHFKDLAAAAAGGDQI